MEANFPQFAHAPANDFNSHYHSNDGNLKKPVNFGLINRGQFCYINCGLQVLGSSQGFTAAVVSAFVTLVRQGAATNVDGALQAYMAYLSARLSRLAESNSLPFEAGRVIDYAQRNKEIRHCTHGGSSVNFLEVFLSDMNNELLLSALRQGVVSDVLAVNSVDRGGYFTNALITTVHTRPYASLATCWAESVSKEGRLINRLPNVLLLKLTGKPELSAIDTVLYATQETFTDYLRSTSPIPGYVLNSVVLIEERGLGWNHVYTAVRRSDSPPDEEAVWWDVCDDATVYPMVSWTDLVQIASSSFPFVVLYDRR